MKYKLLASSYSEDGILELIERYFYSNCTLSQSGKVFNIYSKYGQLNGFRVSVKGDRYRFEEIINT